MANSILANALITHFAKQGGRQGQFLGPQSFSPTHRIQQSVYKSYNKVKKSPIRKRGLKSTIKTPPLPTGQVPGLVP
jgi:hypothetical protein